MKALKLDKPAKIYTPCGCPACNNTGYSGRIGVFEILVCTEKIKETIMDPNFNSEILNNVAEIPTILDNAKERVLAGLTSIEEYEDLSEVISVSNRRK